VAHQLLYATCSFINDFTLQLT